MGYVANTVSFSLLRFFSFQLLDSKNPATNFLFKCYIPTTVMPLIMLWTVRRE